MKRAVWAAIATAAFSLAAHASAQSAAPTRAELLRAKLESRNRSYVFVTMHRVSNGKGPSTEYTLCALLRRKPFPICPHIDIEVGQIPD